jgi:steroid 5-alpha reductase family enzyme
MAIRFIYDSGAGMVTLAAAGWIVAAIVMSGLWAWHLRLKNAGIVDAGWTLLVAGLAVLYAAIGSGASTRRSAIGWMMGSWGARLGVYMLWDRVFDKPEDPRYQTMRREWGERANAAFFWYFQKQALAAVFFSLPALFASANPAPNLSPLELAAAAIWIVGFAGETTADRQLVRFKRNAANRGRTCRDGLWNYSRHPNYFFEWIMWVAYGLFAAASPHGWIALACPAAMLYFLFKVTGIPPAEAQALRSRGDEYREYQRTTSVFVPWFRRS